LAVIQLNKREAEDVVAVLTLLATLFQVGSTEAGALVPLWNWMPEGARGKPFDGEYRTDQAARLRSIVRTISDELAQTG
jgi:hypothetical protein